MIRIFPSRLPGEPLETHDHGDTTIHEWLSKNVTGYGTIEDHPIEIEVDDRKVLSSDWSACHITTKSDVRIYPISYGALGGLIGTITRPITWVFSLLGLGAQQIPGQSQPAQGDSLDLSPAKANMAKLGDPIREILGRVRVYPDYLVQPVSRFDKDNPQIFRTNMFVCIGRGNLSVPPSEIRIGNTPVSAFGDDVRYTIYPPDADVSGDSRADNWFNSTEVGGTGSGTAGLDLASTGPAQAGISADAINLAGHNISVISNSPEGALPESWKPGTALTITAPATFTVSQESGRTIIYGDMAELVPAPSKQITLSWNDSDYNLLISSYQPGSPAIPGIGGNAASITANAAPKTYDFSSVPVAFTLRWDGVNYVISLTANYVTMSGIVDEITEQLTGSGLKALAIDTRLVISEIESPYSGNSIGSTALPVALFGDQPQIIEGVASSGGQPAVLANISMTYDSGAVFAGLPSGSQRLSLTARGKQYRIKEIDGATISVERLIPQGSGFIVDAQWPGFTSRTLLDAGITGLNEQSSWVGPFLCCPPNETTNQVELNFIYPNGLIDIGSKDGKWHWHDVQINIQYRAVGDSNWQSVIIKHGNRTVNEIGYTESINFPTTASYEIRIKRDTPVWGGTTRDSVQWQAMRAKLSARPKRYSGLTTMAITIRTGSRLAAQSDRRVSAVATGLYDGYPSRSISGALMHVLTSVGMNPDQIDVSTINQLEKTYWTPRSEYFDYSADSSGMSALDVLQKITSAGMGYFLLSGGLASAGREGVKPWTGVITPQEMTEEMQTAFLAPSKDDYDAVDVTYTDARTWADEVVHCRYSDKPNPAKVESLKVDGVTDRNRAYRIGMRRLMGYRYQRLTHTAQTEMDALCYQYFDRTVLTDDIPGNQTISCLILAARLVGQNVELTVSEPLDWSFNNPRVLIRNQDGSATRLLMPSRIDDYTLTLPTSNETYPSNWVFDNGSIEPPRLIFCSSDRSVYDAIITDISPGEDGKNQVTAIQYHPNKYQHDDDIYPGA